MIETDAVIVGAGPVGLFQAFQLGLQEVETHVVDALPYPGGQCAELYADKPIYDLPGLPVCTGRELTARLLQQIAPFKTPLHLGHLVAQLQANTDGRWDLHTEAGLHLRSRVVILAAGVGAFVPRRLALEALLPLEGRQVHYHAVGSAALRDQRVVVVGGDEVALEAALTLAQSGVCQRITVVHRSRRVQARAELLRAWQSALDHAAIDFLVGQPIGVTTTMHSSDEPPRLAALQIATGDDSTMDLPCDALLPRLGLSPRLGPLADWGLPMERKQVVVDSARFATGLQGVFAVGDLNTYPGKRKLLVCGFHEATLAAFAVAEYLRPYDRVLLQYTTTSPRLHQLLGVSDHTD